MVAASLTATPSRATPADYPAGPPGLPLERPLISDHLALPTPLSDADSTLYREIFALQKNGKWNKAAARIKKLDDTVLLGHVQAQKYLHPTKYRSKFPELLKWTQHYAGHPQAWRIYRLALRKQLDGWKAPSRPTGPKALRSGPLIERNGPKAYKSPRKRSAKTRRAVTEIQSKILHLIRSRAPTRAYRILRSPKSRKLLDPVECALMRAKIAHAYFVFGKDKLALALARQSIDESDRTIQIAAWAGGLAAWRLGEISTAGKLFETLAGWLEAAPSARIAAAYWAARAHQATGRRQEAAKWLTQAATMPNTLYGLLARHALNLDMSLDLSLPPTTLDHLDRFLKMPGGRRGFALLQIGHRERAELEFHKLYPSLPNVLRPVLMTIAVRHGMPALAVRIADILRAKGHRPYHAALFPVPAWTVPEAPGVGPALIYSVARKESHFDTRARSGRGARGLMQIMPRTAKAVDPKQRLRGSSHHAVLYDPAINIELGSRYIRHLFDTEVIGNDLFKMLAAYNAGPSTLRKWMRRVDYKDDPLLFIESVPSPETRNFLEDTTRNLWMYRLRLGKPTPSLEQVAAGRWPIYDAETGQEIQDAYVRN